MALNTKINLPIATTSALPNINNQSGESQKINELVNKVNRNNTGNIVWESPTSGIIYNTSTYQDNPDIFGKGETGLYNLLVFLYGGEDGWMITSEDYNNISEEINKISSSVSDALTEVDTLKLSVNNNSSSINKIVDGSTIVEKANTANTATTAENADVASRATTADRVSNPLQISVQGVSQGSYDGSVVKSYNVTRALLEVPKVWYGYDTPENSVGDNGDLYIRLKG